MQHHMLRRRTVWRRVGVVRRQLGITQFGPEVSDGGCHHGMCDVRMARYFQTFSQCLPTIRPISSGAVYVCMLNISIGAVCVWMLNISNGAVCVWMLNISSGAVCVWMLNISSGAVYVCMVDISSCAFAQSFQLR